MDKNQPQQPIQVQGNYSPSTHFHNGTDSLPIPPQYITLFTASVSDATVAPTDSPIEGTRRVLYDGTNTLLWVRANKTWISFNSADVDYNINVFGNGNDGDVTLDGTNTYSFLSKSGSDYTMLRDVFFNNLTINTGKTLNTSGFMGFVKGTLTQNGTGKIFNNGGNGGNAGASSTNVGGTGGSAGSATSAGTLPASKAGLAGGAGGTFPTGGTNPGQAGFNGTAGIAVTNSVLTSAPIVTNGAGGAGGTADGEPVAAGGTGAAAGALTTTTSPLDDILSARWFASMLSGIFTQYGGNPSNQGGGGGGSGGGNGNGGFYSGGGGGGGGSGADGGFQVWFVKTITPNSGTTLFQCKGGNGGNGSNGANGTGDVTHNNSGGGGGAGGAGGNGGIVVLIYNTKTSTVTYDVTAGSSGTAGTGGTGAGGVPGTSGSSGQVPTGMGAGTSIEISII